MVLSSGRNEIQISVVVVIQLKIQSNSVVYLASNDEDGEDDDGDEEESDPDADEPHLRQLNCHRLHLISMKIRIIIIWTNLPGVHEFHPPF